MQTSALVVTSLHVMIPKVYCMISVDDGGVLACGLHDVSGDPVGASRHD